MNNAEFKNMLLMDFGVKKTESMDFQLEVNKRVKFLKDYMRNINKYTLVLGVSGGVDSTVVGKLCAMAVKELKMEGVDRASLIAVRLPYSYQRDSDDADEALAFIADGVEFEVGGVKKHELNISSIVDAAVMEAGEAGLIDIVAEDVDFHTGNAKARARMMVQYLIASMNDGVVVGTTNNVEDLMGFYTKYADNAVDVTVLNGLNKRQVMKMAEFLGAPEHLAFKEPAAGLEVLAPLKTDEEAMGIKYSVIDDFLEGKAITESDFEIIKKAYLGSRHKVAVHGFNG